MVQRIAEALRMDAHTLSVLADYVPTDVNQILYQYPVEAPALLREAFGDYAAKSTPIEPEASIPMVDATTARREGTTLRFEALYEVYQADCFDWMAQRAAGYLSDELKTKVTIRAVEIEFFKKSGVIHECRFADLTHPLGE